MTIEEKYTPDITSRECLVTVQKEGALLLREFVSETEQVKLTTEVLSHQLTPVDRSNHTIPEQFEDIGWEFPDCPPRVLALGKRISCLVCPELPLWEANHVRAQLYSPGEVGIDWHRDYKRDLRLVAVASFIGAAQFDIELRQGEVSWQLNPGDLVLMRGALLTGKKDDRPRHRVFAPEQGQRLSVAYRHVTSEVPELEPQHG